MLRLSDFVTYRKKYYTYLLKVVMKPHADLGLHVQQHVMLQVHRPEIVRILFVAPQKNKDHVLDLVSILNIS